MLHLIIAYLAVEENTASVPHRNTILHNILYYNQEKMQEIGKDETWFGLYRRAVRIIEMQRKALPLHYIGGWEDDCAKDEEEWSGNGLQSR